MSQTQKDHHPKSPNDPAFLQRARHDPRWASTTIDTLIRTLTLVINQVDMVENDERQMKTFRNGTTMEYARNLLKTLESQIQ